METVLEILKYILPSVIVFFTAYILVGKFIEENKAKFIYEQKKPNQELVNPLKLQAYERLVVFLERISPQQLIMNNEIKGSSATEAKFIFSEAVKAEYNHNVSQQIYVSPQLWSLIRVVKEEVLEFINSSAESAGSSGTGLDLCKIMVNRLMEEKQQPTQKAIDFLKSEVKLYFA